MTLTATSVEVAERHSTIYFDNDTSNTLVVVVVGADTTGSETSISSAGTRVRAPCSNISELPCYTIKL